MFSILMSDAERNAIRSVFIETLKESLTVEVDQSRGNYNETYLDIKIMLDDEVISEASVDTEMLTPINSGCSEC